MPFTQILEKYSLPRTVKVIIHRSKDGFYVKFPEYAGCFTVAEDPLELYEKITDAILTYFEVPRSVAKTLNGQYLPENTLSSTAKQDIKTDFSLFAALNSLNANHPSFR